MGSRCWRPQPLRHAMGWPELARLGSERSVPRADPDRARRRLARSFRRAPRRAGALGRAAAAADRPRARAAGRPGAHARSRTRSAQCGLALPRRDRDLRPAACCWPSATAPLSDEKREGLIWLGFNLAPAPSSTKCWRDCGPFWCRSPTGRRPSRPCARPGRWARVRRIAQAGLRASSRAGPPTARSSGPRRTWSRSCAPCAAVSSATAIGCTPITTICAARR